MPTVSAKAPVDTKLAQLKACLAAGDTIGALRIAAKFPRLGAHKDVITRAWAAHTNPETYAAMGHDPAVAVPAAIAAIRARFGIADDREGQS